MFSNIVSKVIGSLSCESIMAARLATGKPRPVTMPLQNRVDPFANLFATPARGLLMGNRGGRIHNDDKTLTSRRWASRQWICCVLDFRGRQRDVWGRFYTELFFLDEPTALAAGHRPCFECRRADALRFRDAIGDGARKPSAG